MKYFSPEETKIHKGDIKTKFEKQLEQRPLALKGKSLSIFKQSLNDKNAKVLDFGTGHGAFLKAIYEIGYKDIYACDIDDYVSQEIKPLLKNFRSFDASFEKFPWNNESFDVVTAWEVFEHLENPHNAIREVYRILKPNGLLLMSVPNIFHIVSRLIFLKRGLFPRWNETNNHISMFPHGIFEKTFLKYFNLIKEGYVHAKIALPLINKVKFLPENKWFGNWVYYVLKKKSGKEQLESSNKYGNVEED